MHVVLDRGPRLIRTCVSKQTGASIIAKTHSSILTAGCGLVATLEQRLSDVFNGPQARVGCIPAITTGTAPIQSLPVEKEDLGLSPGEINPGLTPGMTGSPRNR